MLEYKQTLSVGSTRSADACCRTLDVFLRKLRRLGRFSGERLLDVGCGDGEFTRRLAGDFHEAHGIDLQEEYLEHFRGAVKGDQRFVVTHMSASEMSFPDNYFDTVVTIETLEHVPELPQAACEIRRVLKPGGELIITVPNRWFPFENHGMRVGKRLICGRIPLLPYFPWLHRRWSVARVFTVRDLDSLFLKDGFKRVGVDYLWPTFEHDGNRLQRYLKPLFGAMRTMEDSPFRMFGSSVVTRYLKGAAIQKPSQSSHHSCHPVKSLAVD